LEECDHSPHTFFVILLYLNLPPCILMVKDVPCAPTPRARYDHSAVLVMAPPLVHSDGSLVGWGSETEAHLVIHGGRCLSDDASGTETCLNDTHILDLETLRWIPTSFTHHQSSATAAATQTQARSPRKPHLSLINEGPLSLITSTDSTTTTASAEPTTEMTASAMTTISSEPKSPLGKSREILSWDNNFGTLGEDTPSHLLSTSTPKVSDAV
jgi:hypothetical protein